MYLINEEIREILKQEMDVETGEISPEAVARLDALGLDKEAAALDVGAEYKNHLREADAIKIEIESLTQRLEQVQRRANGRLQFLGRYVDRGEKYNDGRCDISWRKASHVEIGCAVAELPEQYRRTKITSEPDKAGLAKALRAGAKVPNCWMQPTQKVVVK